MLVRGLTRASAPLQKRWMTPCGSFAMTDIRARVELYSRTFKTSHTSSYRRRKNVNTTCHYNRHVV